MTITFDGVSSPHKAIIMCDGILEQSKWVTFWPCHPSWSWLMGSLDAVMRRTLSLSRWKRHFELIEGIHDLKYSELGLNTYCSSLDVPYYVQPLLFLTLATNYIFLIHPMRLEYNASENYFWSAAFQIFAKFSKVAIWHTACTVYVAINIQK